MVYQMLYKHLYPFYSKERNFGTNVYTVATNKWASSMTMARINFYPNLLGLF
jgi:hypothetical protein